MNAMSKIAILADSIISMDPKDMKKYNVHIVPLSISDDKGKVYKDNGKDIPTPELFRRLNAGDNFKTSATPMGEIVEKVEELLKVNDFVIGVPVATGLSSQYNTFNMVKGEFEGKMFVVKSITGAIAQEWCIRDLAISLENGVNIADAIKTVEDEFYKTVTYFSVEKVDGLAKGGRATKAVMSAFKLFKLKPIVQLEIKNHFAGMGKKLNDIVDKIIKMIKKDFKGLNLNESTITDIGIIDGGIDTTTKNTIRTMLAKAFNFNADKIVYSILPTVVSVHTYGGAYGIALKATKRHMPKGWKD